MSVVYISYHVMYVRHPVFVREDVSYNRVSKRVKSCCTYCAVEYTIAQPVYSVILHTHTYSFCHFFILALRSPKDGAATTINCAVNPELNTQQCIYYDSCRPATSSAASRCVLQIHLPSMRSDILSPDIIKCLCATFKRVKLINSRSV